MHTKLLGAVALAATTVGLVAPAAPALAAPVAARTTTAAHVPATLHWHDHGPSVARVQRILGLKVTGTFDLTTLRAVERFQRAHHIRATGNVGPLTWAALLKVENSQSPNSAQARALAAAKARAGAALSDLADALDMAGGDVDADSGPNGVLNGAEAAVLNGRLDRVAAHGQALSTALDKARSIGWVKEIGARSDHLIDVTAAIDSQDGAAGVLHPDQAVAQLNAMFDGLVQAAAKAKLTVDPAKESAARASVMSALRVYLTAAGPYARQAWAIDPFSAGAPARIASLRARAEALPQARSVDAALNSYVKVFGTSFDPTLPTLPGLRADSRSTRTHLTATLPTVPWLH